jgi:uncharacterized protein YbjQ (UPF0145 family)
MTYLARYSNASKQVRYNDGYFFVLEDTMTLYSHGTQPDEPIRVGGIVHASAVSAANVARDIRENIRNLTGGKMQHYERLIDSTVARALENIKQKAQDAGYDGVIGVTLSHPVVVEGGVEVIVYGNGFHYQ